MSRRSRRLQRFIDLGHIDEEWAQTDPEAAERDAGMLEEWEKEGEEDDDAAETACTAPPPATQTIVNVDCLEHMRGIPTGSVDCIVTSPPYNLGKRYSLHNDSMEDGAYLDWQSRVAVEVVRILRPSGHLFLNVGWNSKHPERSIEVFLRYRERLKLQNRITWVKSIALDASTLPPPLREAMHERQVGHFMSLNSAKYLNMTTEDIWHLTPRGASPIDPRAEGVGVGYVWADQPARFGHHRERHCRGNAWHIPYRTVQSAAEHDDNPATFPVALALQCLRLANLSSGAVVLDPFAGIGTTLLAARQLDVSAIGLEIDPKYCAAAQRRLDAAAAAVPSHDPT
jgi:site-specific DNA-methyltransferase (adenine-specific)